MTEPVADFGVIGLAVMGQNLVLNLSDHGHKVAVYNRTARRMEDFISGAAAGRDIFGAHDLESFVDLLDSPRMILLMIKAGQQPGRSSHRSSDRSQPSLRVNRLLTGSDPVALATT
jgi:6-phosphogluconate dehydrogenase